jgi:twinkle protein
MTAALPYGAAEIVAARQAGNRPADVVLVSIIGPLREINPVVIAKPNRAIDWRFLVDLDVLLVADSTTDGAAVRRTVSDLAAVKPSWLGLWLADVQDGAEVRKNRKHCRPAGVRRARQCSGPRSVPQAHRSQCQNPRHGCAELLRWADDRSRHAGPEIAVCCSAEDRMNLIPDTIDFDAYLKGPAENAHVKPASAWLDEVIERFRHPVAAQGTRLPWPKYENFLRLRPGELTIWPGMNGHGKSMLVSHVMAHAMAEGDKVCIASMEMTPAQTMQRMCRQVFGSNGPLTRDIREMHHWTDGKLWIYDQQGGVTPERILAVARYTRAELGVNHFVVDNLLSCGIPEDGDGWLSKQKAFVLALATHAHDTGQSIHLIAHSKKLKDEFTAPGKYDIKGSGSISDLADNVFTVWRNKAKEKAVANDERTHDHESDCLLIVDKHRHGEWEGAVKLWYHAGAQSYTDHDAQHPMPIKFINEAETVEF